ncbi:hypothetical protein LguiA_036399 [Lonicera macranthoides]
MKPSTVLKKSIQSMNTKPLRSQKLTQVQTLIKLLCFSSIFNLNPSTCPYKNL